MILVHHRDRYVLVISCKDCTKLYQEMKSFLLQNGKCDECDVPLNDFSPCQCSLGKDNSDTLCIAVGKDFADTLNPLFNRERKRESYERSLWNRAFNRQYCPGVHTKKDLVDILAIQDGTCYFCDTDLTGKKTHDDHLTPVSRDGDEWPTNMAITCISCNLSKSDLNEREFWDEQKGELGEPFVAELRAKRREQKKEKEKLTRLRKLEVKANIKTFEKRLKEAFGPEVDLSLEVTYEDNGITIWIDGIIITALPHSHRLVGSWAKKNLTEMAAMLESFVRLVSSP